MIATPTSGWAESDDASLRLVLEEMLRCRGESAAIRQITHVPGAYRSSCALHDVAVLFEHGEVRHFIVKDLSPRRLLSAASAVRPGFLYDPTREIRVYRDVLASQRLGTPEYLGSIANAQTECYWLFLERVEGAPLFEIGALSMWRRVAEWLAHFHDQFANLAHRESEGLSLFSYDAAYYRMWFQRSASREPRLAPFRRAYDGVIGRLCELPRTLIHGEFYASNILVSEQQGRVRIAPVDWELAALAPGVMDLAALTSGHWSQAERETMARAYYDALSDRTLYASFDRLLEALDYGRLHQALQWLGWSAQWTPPREHTQNWLGQALQLIDKLGLAPASSEPRRLIVNADDFGQSPGINRGIIMAHEQGIVSSASLMVRWPAAAQAAEYARRRPTLSVGLHLDLGEWTCANGEWVERYRVVESSDADAVRREVLRQLDEFRRLLGRDPSHIDSHQHVHREDPVRSIVLEIARTLGAPVRHFSKSIRYCGDFYGQSGRGESYPDGIAVDGLHAILASLPGGGITELGCHPAEECDMQSMYAKERAIELKTLCDPAVRSNLENAGIELCSFHSFAGEPTST